MASNLVIVESPAKAKTIAKFLGDNFIVESCYGHIRDLPSKNMGVDIEHNFVPNYVVNKDKSDLVNNLKRLAKKAELIWLASDEDREGEAIAWHLAEILELKPDNMRRIVFNEITKKAILHAVDNPRQINMELVDAQQARRVLDRIVGYELSPVLWSKVKRGLSAGRVQSVSVRLIVEKEREIENFNPKESYKVHAYLKEKSGEKVKATLSNDLKHGEEAKKVLDAIKKSPLKIQDLKTKPAYRNPSATFTTSTLQQEASSKLGYSVSRTMSLAQKLYEAGHITYMRTDSPNLSDTAMGAIKDEIMSKWGEKYYRPKQYSGRTKNAQEAHEAIRPTHFEKSAIPIENDQARLYDLIWKRTVASQMSQAVLEKTIYTVDYGDAKNHLKIEGLRLNFDGFMVCVGEKTEDVILPVMQIGDSMELITAKAVHKLSSPPIRYNEATLVKKLEELGIGRPSTYAPTINTIQKREYVAVQDVEGKDFAYVDFKLEAGQVIPTERVEKFGKQNKRLCPTKIGVSVSDFLSEHFPKVMNYEFTAQVEMDFDQIASGASGWTSVLDAFYKGFHANVEKAKSEADRVDTSRYLGVHPETGLNISVRLGRFGPMIQHGGHEKFDEQDKATFASIPKPQTIEKITLEQCLELLKLPKFLGEFEEKEVVLAVGKYGPYLKWNNSFISVNRNDFTAITMEEARVLLEEKKKELALPTFDLDGELIKVAKGRYGVYFKYKKKNYPLPKNIAIEQITVVHCKEAIEKKDKAKPKKKSIKK